MRILSKDLTEEQRREFYQEFKSVSFLYRVDPMETGEFYLIECVWDTYPNEILQGNSIKEMARNYYVKVKKDVEKFINHYRNHFTGSPLEPLELDVLELYKFA